MVGELQTGDPCWAGPYRLMGRLGAGGMGQVFLGRSRNGALAAVKVIRPELAGEPGFRERFAREVAAAANVSGRFTALVLDADVQSATPWLATAYVAGPSLAQAVTSGGPLPVPSVLALATGLARGLGAIHAAGVVHRDLKPANVLLAGDGPRVSDFGISRSREASRLAQAALTQAGMVVGSPGFMSPEQAVGAEVGPPSDVFSLGAVLAFAATGRHPFGNGTPPVLMYRVVHEEPDLSGLSGALWPLVRWCLAKDAGQRPGAGELLAWLGGARRPGPGASRHRAPAGTVLVPAVQAASASVAVQAASASVAGRAAAARGRIAGARSRRRRPRRGPVWAGVLAGFVGMVTVTSGLLPGAGRDHAATQPGPEVQARLAPASSGTPGGADGPVTRRSTAAPAAPSLPGPSRSEPSPTGPSPSGPSLAVGEPVRPARPAPSGSAAQGSPAAGPSPSPEPVGAAPPVPQILTATTYTNGGLVYVSLTYSDPGHNAAGFGLARLDGASRAPESHPFASPSAGVVSVGSISYAFDLECGTTRQRRGAVEAWIYDTAGRRSPAVTVPLACAS